MGAVNSLLASVFEVVAAVLDLYVWLLIIGAVLSWLVMFDVINARNRFVQVMGDIYTRLTEPLLQPLRRIIPVINGIDLSPLALIFIIMFLQRFITRLAYTL